MRLCSLASPLYRKKDINYPSRQGQEPLPYSNPSSRLFFDLFIYLPPTLSRARDSFHSRTSGKRKKKRKRTGLDFPRPCSPRRTSIPRPHLPKATKYTCASANPLATGPMMGGRANEICPMVRCDCDASQEVRWGDCWSWWVR